MKRSTEMGMNRTGMDISKILSKEMIENLKAQPEIGFGPTTSSSLRGEFFKDANAVGSVPIPGTL